MHIFEKNCSLINALKVHYDMLFTLLIFMKYENIHYSLFMANYYYFNCNMLITKTKSRVFGLISISIALLNMHNNIIS